MQAVKSGIWRWLRCGLVAFVGSTQEPILPPSDRDESGHGIGPFTARSWDETRLAWAECGRFLRFLSLARRWNTRTPLDTRQKDL